MVINLEERNLLQQWKTQINIPPLSETNQKTSDTPDKKN